tara:strand:+ start:129 stop:587 length:459 start_codon:yes stop_codon:yes gene_type:complete
MNPISHTLIHLLENQHDRTRCALEGLRETDFTRAADGDCNNIQAIGEHMITLRGFQLLLLGSELGKQMPESTAATLRELNTKLDQAFELVRQAIESHDPEDWYAEPTEPREGPWAELPTVVRVVRPINDFTNHIGGIRALRRIFGNPAEKTQ